MPSTSRDIQPYKPSNCLKRCPKDIFARFKNTQLQFQTLIIKEILRQTGKAQIFSHDFFQIRWFQDLPSFNEFGVAATGFTEPTKEPTPWRKGRNMKKTWNVGAWSKRQWSTKWLSKGSPHLFHVFQPSRWNVLSVHKGLVKQKGTNWVTVSWPSYSSSSLGPAQCCRTPNSVQRASERKNQVSPSLILGNTRGTPWFIHWPIGVYHHFPHYRPSTGQLKLCFASLAPRFCCCSHSTQYQNIKPPKAQVVGQLDFPWLCCGNQTLNIFWKPDTGCA